MERRSSPTTTRQAPSFPARGFGFPEARKGGRKGGWAGAWGGLRLSLGLVAGVTLLYVLLTLRANLRYPSPSPFWFTLATLVSPIGHVLTILIIVPALWRIRWGFGRTLDLLLSLASGLVASEILLGSQVFADAWLRSKAGLPSARIQPILQGYLLVIAPTATLIAGLIAARAKVIEEKEAAKEEAIAARTRLLQSQMHPHVLFNALNNLAELIHKDPPSAETSVRHLADLLRRILDASEHETWRLSEERKLVQDYLLIEGLRLGPRLRVAWDWDAGLDPVHVPPLIVQPLVENAIKHGISPSRGGGDLVIRARDRDGALVVEVWNSGEPHRAERGWGIGLSNLTARLDLSGARGDTFHIGPADEGTLATVRLEGRLID